MVEQTENFDTVSDFTEERRTFDRFPSRFPAKFKDARDDFGTNVYLRNASAEGARITTKEHLYLNDGVTLEVELPDGQDAMVIRGEVVWTKHKEADMWDVGLKFHKTVLMDMWRIFKFATTSSSAA